MASPLKPSMKHEKKRYILDSSALLAFFRDESGANTVQTILHKADKRKLHIYLPVLQLGEILYVTHQYLDKKTSDSLREIIHSLPIQLLEINASHAEVAAQYKAQGGIAYPDCFVIALAREKRATILTKDREFKKFEKDVKIEWL